MVGLELCDCDESTRRQVVARLRGAVEVAGGEAAAMLLAGHDTLRRATQSASQGRHVLLTVDAIDSHEQLDSLAVAARAGGGHLILANLSRYWPSRQVIKHDLDAGKLGAPGLLRIHHWENPSGGGVHGPGDLSPSMRRSLDLALWLFGQRPDSVYAVQAVGAASPAHGRNGVLVHLGFAAGGMALLDQASLPPSATTYDALSLIGSAGAAYADDQSNFQLWYGRDGVRAVPATEGIRSVVQLLQSFIDRLTKGGGSDDGVESWRDVLLVTDAVKKSLATRRVIRPEVP